MTLADTILVVDDRAENREYLATLLGYRGFRVVQAGDGREALDLVRTERPALVICDILMPTMDGYEFVRQVRTEPGIANTAVVFCTAHYLEDEARSLARECGVEEVLTKPCEPEQVLDAVQRVLGRSEPVAGEPTTENSGFARAHLRLVTDKLSRTVEELEQVNAQLTAMIQLNVRLASEREPGVLLHKVCIGASELFSASFGAIGVRERNGEDTAFLVTTLDEDASAGSDCKQHRLNHGALGRMLSEGGGMRLRREGRSFGLIGVPDSFPDFDSLVAAPIASLTQTYGWICLTDKKHAQEFADDDQQLLTTLGAQVGRIYENGSLYARVQQHATALEGQIVQREKAQRRLAAQYAVADVLANDASMEATTGKLLHTLCVHLGFSAAVLWETDRGAGLLQCLDVWVQRGRKLQAFADSSRSLALSRGQGIPGKVWKTLRPYWSIDLVADEGTERARAADRAELKAAVGIPILIQEHVAGVVELFGAQPVQPDSEWTELLAALAKQIAQFLERRAQEQQIQRLNRVYAVLSGINSIIVRVRGRDELFVETCRIAVEHGRFGVAWISLVDGGTGLAKPEVWAGVDAVEIASGDLHGGGSNSGAESVVVRGIREARPVYSNDILAEAASPPRMHRLAIERGFRSMIALPLKVNGVVVACLGLAAEDREFFTSDELRLLEELAGDISFALQFIDKQETLSYIARNDLLTGLPNRTAFVERLAHRLRIAEGRQLALLIIDVRQFRRINDSFGRQAGDAMLRELASRLQAQWADPSNLARVAADTFAVAIPGVRGVTEIAHLLGSRLLPALNASFRIDGQELAIGTFVGVAVSPGDGENAEALFGNAEAALKNAKRTGERYLFYRPEMNARTAEVLLLENQLRRAIEESRFVLHYQPIVDVKNRKVMAVEALIRLQGADGKLVPPVEFIPLLEESGLILEVGAWVIGAALDDRKRWRIDGAQPPRVAVNVSPLQLRQQDFISIVERSLHDRSDTQAGLDLEITESVIMQDIETNIGKLAALRRMGVNVAIDDFGTGYSSLAYLSRLPVNALKIDRSFIAAMDQPAEGTPIVETIVALAHSMGVEVIAEGVETEAQAEVLERLGCNQMQGFLIARPMPADELTKLL